MRLSVCQPTSSVAAIAAALAAVALGWAATGCRPQGSGDGAGATVERNVAPPQRGEGGPIVGDELEPPAVGVADEVATSIQLESSAEGLPADEFPEAETAPSPSDRPTVLAAATDEQTPPAPEAIVGGDASGPEDWRQWPEPACVLVISGQQHGYIEPCGCTGLENQKGGMARRYTLVRQIREAGWEAVPLDAGNQVRRVGRQAAIKFQTTVKGLTQLGYRAIGFGPDDLRLGASELLSVAASDEDNPSPFASANIELLAPDLVPLVQRIEAGGMTIGVTTALDPSIIESPLDDAIVIAEQNKQLTIALEQLKEQNCDFTVLLLQGDRDAASQVARDVPGFDLVVAAHTYGEPTYQAVPIEGTNSRMIVTGDKGMYVGLVGLYRDQPLRYARVALTSEFEDAPEMLQLMAEYQGQLKALGLEGLQVRPISHPSGREYVGTETCGECHTTAYEIWQGTPHAEATEDIVHPGERSEIPRHFDPECLSCHVTGWNPQSYYPYTSGYLSLEKTPHMTGSGCENCHGPGAAHVAAERDGSGLSEEEIDALRAAMRLDLADARDKCMECHDLDNSPDFHQPGAFDDYWAEIEHYGLD